MKNKHTKLLLLLLSLMVTSTESYGHGPSDREDAFYEKEGELNRYIRQYNNFAESNNACIRRSKREKNVTSSIYGQARHWRDDKNNRANALREVTIAAIDIVVMFNVLSDPKVTQSFMRQYTEIKSYRDQLFENLTVEERSSYENSAFILLLDEAIQVFRTELNKRIPNPKNHV